MKAIKIVSIMLIMALFLPSQLLYAQDKASADSTGLPGDNFSLQGALELFKKSSSLEDFEKRLNDKSNNVNNLDLNGDDKVDYVKVTDKMDKDAHAIVLRVNVNAKESQDIAVIAVEQTGAKSAVVQIIGDKEIYGEEVIVEPLDKDESSVVSPRSKGPYAPEVRSVIIIVNVWHWPVIQYMYMPDYMAWHSPWYWGYYPPYWNPWRPYPWHYHYQHSMHYYNHCHVVYVHRTTHARNVYNPYRQSSPTVNRRIAQNNSNRPAGRAAARPVENGRAVEKRPVDNTRVVKPAARPVEGTQGSRKTKPTREATPQRSTPNREAPATRSPERRTAQPIPQRQEPRQAAPRQQPQQTPRAAPQQRQPQMRTAPPQQRSAPASRPPAQNGSRRGR